MNHATGSLSNLNSGYRFHGIDHTREVVRAARKIANECKLGTQDATLVQIAAWYHDTGFSISPFNHEFHSKEIARQFLMANSFPKSYIDQVIDCIRTTRMPQQPKNLIEAVICDAVMYHLAGNEYWKKNISLKREQEFITNKKIRDDQWCHENLNFLTQHRYCTDYGKRVLKKFKLSHLSENVRRLEALKTA